MTQLQRSKQLGLAVGTIAISSILNVTCLSGLALAEMENEAVETHLSSPKVSLCQASLYKGSGDLFDYAQTVSVPTSQPVKLAHAQSSSSTFSGFKTATYTKGLSPVLSGSGGIVWCEPCPYYPASGCWAFIGDCQ